MKIYLIRSNASYQGESGGYESHVIAANSITEVVRIAKNNAALEGKGAWDKNGVELVGVHIDAKTEPYIILSNFVSEP